MEIDLKEFSYLCDVMQFRFEEVEVVNINHSLYDSIVFQVPQKKIQKIVQHK